MNDITQLQAQIDKLTNELRSAQTRIQGLKKRKWKSFIVVSAFLVASGVGSWSVDAFSSSKTLMASSPLETQPTKIQVDHYLFGLWGGHQNRQASMILSKF